MNAHLSLVWGCAILEGESEAMSFNPFSSGDPDELLIREVREKAQRLAESGRQQLEIGQFVNDLAGKVDNLRKYRPSVFSRGQFLDISNLLDQYPYESVANVVASLSSTSLTVGSSALYGVSETYLSSFEVREEKAGERSAAHALWLTVTAKADEPLVVSLMRRFGLDKASVGQESPLSFFETAMATIRRPPLEESASAPSLLSMRSAIEKTIDSLVARRPTQEPAGNWETKVRSIAKQMKLDSISDLTVDEWVNQLAWLIKNLSSSKDKKIAREICESRLRRAILFLRGLLEGLNSDKLKR